MRTVTHVGGDLSQEHLWRLVRALRRDHAGVTEDEEFTTPHAVAADIQETAGRGAVLVVRTCRGRKPEKLLEFCLEHGLQFRHHNGSEWVYRDGDGLRRLPSDEDGEVLLAVAALGQLAKRIGAEAGSVADAVRMVRESQAESSLPRLPMFRLVEGPSA